MIPAHPGEYEPEMNAVCVALRLVVQDCGLAPDDSKWTIRCEVGDDGTLYLHPIFPLDVPKWVEEMWTFQEGHGLPSNETGWTLEPDR
jgi:hypothetical protein